MAQFAIVISTHEKFVVLTQSGHVPQTGLVPEVFPKTAGALSINETHHKLRF
jgi:hypothetical protein